MMLNSLENPHTVAVTSDSHTQILYHVITTPTPIDFGPSLLLFLWLLRSLGWSTGLLLIWWWFWPFFLPLEGFSSEHWPRRQSQLNKGTFFYFEHIHRINNFKKNNSKLSLWTTDWSFTYNAWQCKSSK